MNKLKITLIFALSFCAINLMGMKTKNTINTKKQQQLEDQELQQLREEIKKQELKKSREKYITNKKKLQQTQTTYNFEETQNTFKEVSDSKTYNPRNYLKNNFVDEEVEKETEKTNFTPKSQFHAPLLLNVISQSTNREFPSEETLSFKQKFKRSSSTQKSRTNFVSSPIKKKTEPIKKKTEISNLTFEQLVNDKTGKIITKDEFEKVGKAFLDTYKDEEGYGSPRAVKKIINADTKTAIHADFHGDKLAMYAFIEDLKEYFVKDEHGNPTFKIKKNSNVQIVFLGDFTDRGPDGLEVLYTAMRLRAENPDKVLIVRGNHEDLELNFKYGFSGEIRSKWKIENDEIFKILDPIYNALPYVIYSGAETSYGTIDYTMLVHGGIDDRFDPKNLLKSSDLFKSEKLPTSLDSYPSGYGFLWNDFDMEIQDIKAEEQEKSESRSLYGKDFKKEDVKNYFSKNSNNKYKISNLIRGHHHAGNILKTMNKRGGIYIFWGDDQDSINITVNEENGDTERLIIPQNTLLKNGEKKDIPLKQNSVCTILASTKMYERTKYTFTFDAYVVLNFNTLNDEWRLCIKNTSTKNFAKEWKKNQERIKKLEIQKKLEEETNKLEIQKKLEEKANKRKQQQQIELEKLKTEQNQQEKLELEQEQQELKKLEQKQQRYKKQLLLKLEENEKKQKQELEEKQKNEQKPKKEKRENEKQALIIKQKEIIQKLIQQKELIQK